MGIPDSGSPAPIATPARRAVIGTAGHIDHGKTALVRRLTGVDTDRLPEEKARGISIDLGFARLVTPAGIQVGIVDVPGHERFVKNMLAGVGGIDLVLLVIAADEGVMPQTREHVAIVRLLGVARGIVVLTKQDLVERDWMELVRRDVRALLAPTALADSPLVEFSAVTGAGEPELLAAIDRQLVGLETRDTGERVRLPIDRVFTVEGFGTVVTGTLWRGRIRGGDHLEILPVGHPVRVRRVQVHGSTVEEAGAGQRTAVALHGVATEQVERGDWLVATGSLRASSILDVRFELLHDAPHPWKSDTRVRFHLGAGEQIGRLVLLERSGLEAGSSALAQVRLEKPTVASRGDRFVIRSYSPSRTVGGGVVIEPVAAKRRRRAAQLAELALDESGSPESRLLQRLGREARPLSTAALSQGIGEDPAAVAVSLATLQAGGWVVAPVQGRWLLAAVWESALERIQREVDDYAVRHPARFGIPKGELKSTLKAELDGPLFDPAFEAIVARGAVELRGERVRPAARPWEPPAEVVAALERVAGELEAAGLAVPEVATWQAALPGLGPEVLSLGYFLGRLVRVSQELSYTARQLDGLRARLAAHFARSLTLSVAEFKQLAGVSRKYAVPLLEHCDRVGWTARAGDDRRAGGKLGA
ncbi:MAG TPA: selenocysteine-specific translation elongation factor [Candidatus Eisenbacteria bacterium]|jgi:selenocysteine-specific elongation factor